MKNKIKGNSNVATRKVNERFEKVSTDLFYYLELNILKTQDIVQYIKLLQLFNEDYGYAFPTIYQLEEMLNTSKSSILRSNKRLKEAGLLEIGKGKNGNNIYIPMQPLSKNELYQQVPDLVQQYEERRIKIETRTIVDRSRLEYFNNTLNYQSQNKGP